MKLASGVAAASITPHGDQHGDDHDRDVLGHADRRDDAVDGKHQVQEQDLDDGGRESDLGLRRLEHVRPGIGIDVVMDFLGGLPDQEQAARDQDQVAPREAVIEDGEHRIGQAYDDGDGAEQEQTQDQRRADAHTARVDPMTLGQLIGQNRDEDEVVDPEHHLHGDQGGERDPGSGIHGQREQVVHCSDASHANGVSILRTSKGGENEYVPDAGTRR